MLRRLGIGAVAAILAVIATACSSSKDASGGNTSGSSATTTSAGGCTPAHQFSTIAKGKLTIAITEVAPYSESGQGVSKPTGIDGDIITKIAQMECVSITGSVTPYSAAISSVQTKRDDMTIGGWYRTADRNKVVGLTNPMYLDQMAFISRDKIPTIQDLKGKKVGTVNGYIFVEGLKSLLGSSLKIYPDTAGMLQDMSTGRLQVAVVGSGTASDVVENGKTKGLQFSVPPGDAAVPASIQPAQICFPFTQSNTALGDALNADIAKLKASGDLAKILAKYHLPASLTNTGNPRLIGAG
jgi:polar amino acid transport system substrate-binding protein